MTAASTNTSRRVAAVRSMFVPLATISPVGATIAAGTPAEVRAFVRGMKDTHAVGASLYSWPGMSAVQWRELEPVKRGIYGGACGYLSYAGDLDVAIAIRTGIVQNQTLYVQAAAGVVADSVPEMEWRETEAKARALIRAAELVEEGF